MPHPLETRLADIRRRVRGVLAIYGVSCLATAVIGAVVLVCFADWLLHFDDGGVRLILDIGLVALAGWLVQRYLWSPLRQPLRDLDLALRIEQRYPGFQDSLASTVEFLEKDADPRVGSPALQRAVIEQTLSQVEHLDFSDLIQTRIVRRVALAAVVVCLMTAVLVGFNQPETAISLERLAFPFSGPDWPRRTNLALFDAEWRPLEFDEQDPLRVARGDAYKFYVENRAENRSSRLPSKVALQYKFADGKTTTEPLRGATLRDSAGQPREVAVAQVPAVKGPLWFRAVGGDHTDMDWYQMLVIPPPVVESLQVTLTPPAYTKRPEEKLPEGVGHIQGLIGTRVAIATRVNKPLSSAGLRLHDQDRQAATLSADGRKLTAEFTIREAGLHSYWLDLRDKEGFENSDAPRYEIRGVQDLVPDISIETPAADMQVTADAEIPLRAIARDDLGLKQIRLQYKLGDSADSPAGTVVLFDGNTVPALDDPLASTVVERPRERTAEMVWKIADLNAAYGTRIVFYTEATDDYDLGPEHIGRSILRTLTVVSREDKLRELAQRQANLLDDVERAFKLQTQAREQVGELQLQMQKTGNFRAQDVDMLQRVELSQRQIAARVNAPTDGLQQRTRDLLNELRDNKLDDAETQRRAENMSAELARVGDEYLPAIEQDLTQTRKLAQGQSPAEAAAEQRAASKNQATKSASPTTGTPKNPAVAKGKESATPGETKQPTPANSEKDAPTSPTDATGKQKSAASQPASKQKSPASPKSKDTPSLPKALERVAENQNAVLESLGELQQELAQWRNERDATQDVAEIAAGQAELNKQTAETGRQTLTKPREQLSQQEQADLARLAERQKKQAERFEQVEEKLREMIARQEKDNPDAAATLRDALEQSRQEAIAGRMREASAQVGENRIGEAARSQEQALEQLREMENILRNRRESDAETLVKKLKQAEQELASLREQQDELLKKVQKAAEIPDAAEREAELQKLQQEQQRLRDEASKTARRLQRMQASRPGEAARRAAERMQQAGEDLAQNEAAEAANDQQEALDDLEQAQRELARERRQAEEQLAQEQLEKISDELRGMIAREQSVIEETQRLESLRAAGSLSRAQLRSLRDLADTQTGLKQETDRLVETLTAAEVFALALKGASRNMQQAIDRLNERDTGTATQKAETSARQRFIDLVEALKPEKLNRTQAQRNQQQQEQQPGAGEGEQSGPPGEAIPALAQLKMLKTLQQELNTRTAELAAIREAKGQLTPAEQSELESIARDQGSLADLARNLTEAAAAGNPNDESPKDEGKPKSE